ncbi:hypothetical protein H9L09_08380 [Nocardioides mesophilus]|uniref:Uncharacterized protein n=1 Tax=Nocardioides mesophilus TaxID=433659 RepID=A0A7G9RH46_9ACTN|nr:hypothetical protein H9L09_08380 [Nocardioides mesophilus]
MDGPVVTAARQALEADDVDLVLPFVPEDGEAEVRAVFDRVQPVLRLGDAAREVAEQLFFETVVRVHRAGEGAPYTGLTPAGQDVGPVIPLAERAIETGSPDAVAGYLTGLLQDELEQRLEKVNALAALKDQSVSEAREYVEAMLGFELYSHHLLEALQAAAHGDAGNGHSHG